MTYHDRNVLLTRLGFTGYEECSVYDEYLQSSLWRKVRAAAWKKHGNICSLCRSTAVVLHHLDYSEQTLIGEDLDGLTPLCQRCHEKVEFTLTGEKRSLEEARNEYRRIKAGELRIRSPRRRCACGKPINGDHELCKYCTRKIRKKVRLESLKCTRCKKNNRKKDGPHCGPCMKIVCKSARPSVIQVVLPQPQTYRESARRRKFDAKKQKSRQGWRKAIDCRLPK